MITINKTARPVTNDTQSPATERMERDRVYAEGLNALDTIDEFLRGAGRTDGVKDERLWALYHKLIDEEPLNDEDRKLIKHVGVLLADTSEPGR